MVDPFDPKKSHQRPKTSTASSQYPGNIDDEDFELEVANENSGTNDYAE